VRQEACKRQEKIIEERKGRGFCICQNYEGGGLEGERRQDAFLRSSILDTTHTG